MSCETCKYARFACISEYGNVVYKGMIACAYWTCYSQTDIDPEGEEVIVHIPKNQAMARYVPENIVLYEGWADLGRSPKDKNPSGIITNLCVLLHCTSTCGMYKVDK